MALWLPQAYLLFGFPLWPSFSSRCLRRILDIYYRSKIILLRVLGTATTMIILFSTTPFPCIFASLGKILPRFLITTFFMTYRSIFILFSIFNDIRSGFKLRGGLQLKHPKRSLYNLARAFGYLIIKGIDDSQRFYENLKIRGFQGKIVHHRRFCIWIKK